MELADSYGWDSARKYLPLDLDGLARRSGLLTRLRGVGSAEDLTRLLLMCAVPKVSLRAVAGWARESGLSTMGWTGLFLRLRESEAFLEACFVEVLSHGAGSERLSYAGYNLVAVDATVLCGPRADGPDQRLHTVYDLSSGMPRSVELTSRKGGENLARHTCFGKGDLVLADRGYGYAKNVLACLKTQARLLIRFEFACIRLLDAATGEVVSLKESESVLPHDGRVELAVRIPGCPTPLRALGSRNDKGKAVWLLTDLGPEDLPLEDARELYRARWQVELFFKRLKSILDLDELPTRDGPTARPWIWAKLALAALATLLGNERFSPWEQGEVPLAQILKGTSQDDRGLASRKENPKQKTTSQKVQTSYPTCLLEA